MTSRRRSPASVRARAVVIVASLVLVHVAIDLLATFAILDRAVADVLAWFVLVGIATSCVVLSWWALSLSEAVELGERRLALAANAAQLGMWDLDLVRGTSFNDDVCRAIYGIGHLPADGVRAAVYESLVHPEDAAHRAEQLRVLEADPAVRHHAVTFRMVRPDGRIVWVTDTGAILRDATGRPVRKIGFSQDVTAQRELLERVGAAAERVALVAEAAGLGAWQTDLAAGRTERDDVWCRIHGVAPADAPTDWAGVLALVHPDDRARVDAERQALVLGGGSGVLRYRVVRADDGHVRHVENWMAFRRAAGVVTAMAGFVLDVTERERAVAQVAASEERFRSLVANLPDTLYRIRICDPAEAAVPPFAGLRIEYASPGLVRLTGVSAEDAVHDPALVLDRIHPDDRSLFADLVRRPGPVGPVVIRCVLPDGAVTWSEHRCFVTARADGTVVAVDGIARDITLTKRYEEQLAHETTHDAVTSLPRREAFLARLDAATAAEPERPVSLLAVHVGRMSYVSDVFGQASGELLLQDAADRLRRRLRPGDLLARTGPSEFAVALLDTTSAAAAERADALVGVLRRPFSVGGATVSCTASAGVASSAMGSSAMGWSAAAVLDQARAALARAKAGRSAAIEVFEPSVLDELQRRRSVGMALQRAVDDGELRLFVQPEVDLRTGAVVGGEALVRWQRPDRGLVLPGDFIPLAEQLGMEREIGRWVVAHACTLAARLRRSVDPSFVLRCNLSALELADPDLADRVARSLAAAELPPSALCLEVTETAVLADLEVGLATIQRLKDLGVALALDDFGTGYSSLVYLKRFPVDAVKIDRSFVHDVAHDGEDLAIVAATVQLAHALDRHVTAEGIETEAQLTMLRDLGCDTGQGFLFARPLPVEDFERWCLARVSRPCGSAPSVPERPAAVAR